ncbi:MAG: CDP-alcohol phosphatidyltransferase family protein [Candidatus Actinomarina sp.]
MNFKDILLLPNLITLFRFFSAIYLFFYYSPQDFNVFILVSIIAIIGLSDSLDGIVARRYNLVSELGVILDPLTDRIVFIILLFWLNIFIPNSLIYAILLREFLVLIGSLYVLIKGLKINVSNKGKFATVLLFINICLFVINSSLSIPFINQLTVIVIIFYFYVAIEYLYNLIYKSG